MSFDLVRRGNNAVAVNGNTLNGVTAQIASTVRGSSFYFAICAIMGFVGFTVLGLGFTKPRSERIFYYITAAINLTACIAYFTMGSNLGWAPIAVEFARSDPRVSGVYRAVFYARYIDWVVTTPLLLMDLLLTAALPWPTILWVIFLDEIMIITGLIGALVTSRYKFGFFAIGCFAMFAVFYELAFVGLRHATALGKDVRKVYLSCGVLTLVVWLCYPIAWGVSEGGNVIAPDSEAVFYGVLDFIAKPVFSAALIAGHWSIAPARLGLRIREYGEPLEHPVNETEKTAQRESNMAHNSNNQNGNTTSNHYTGNTTSTTTNNNAGPVAGTAVGTDTGYNTGANVHQEHDHATHTAGFAPVHERTTVEGHHTQV